MTKETDKLIEDILKKYHNWSDREKNMLIELAEKMQEENKYLYEQSEWIERKEISLAVKEFEEKIDAICNSQDCFGYKEHKVLTLNTIYNYPIEEPKTREMKMLKDFAMGCFREGWIHGGVQLKQLLHSGKLGEILDNHSQQNRKTSDEMSVSFNSKPADARKGEGEILDNQDYNKRNYSENPPCLDGGNHSQASVNMHGSNNEQVEMVKHSPDAKDKKGLDNQEGKK